MADEIIIETTSSQTLEVGTPGPQGPKGDTGDVGPAGPTIADANAPATNNILWQIRTTAFTAASGGRYVANGTFTVTNPASGNNGELFQVVVASGTVTVNGVAYGASRWPVTVARISGAWTTLANTLTENLTLNGTNSTAPNQSASSGASLMTRDLVAQRSWDLSETPRIIHYNPDQSSVFLGGSGTRSISFRAGAVFPTADTASGTAVASIDNNLFPAISLDNVASFDGGYGGYNYDNDILWEIPFHMRATPNGTTDAGIIRCGTGTKTDATTFIERRGWQLRWQVTGGQSALRFCRTLTTTGVNSPAITDASNASPIVLTFGAAHSLANGDQIEVGNVGGNTNANGIFTVDNITSTTCELVGSSGNAAYTSGGEAHRISNELYTHPAGTLRLYYVRAVNTQFIVSVGSATATPLITTSGRSGKRIGTMTFSVLSTNGRVGFTGHALGPFRIAIR
jgi:hypothetical protein